MKTTEWAIVFCTRDAEKGWTDVLATKRNSLAKLWDDLAHDPLVETSTCHTLRGALATIQHHGQVHARRQYELPGGARVWYIVLPDQRGAGTVVLTDVHTSHPRTTGPRQGR